MHARIDKRERNYSIVIEDNVGGKRKKRRISVAKYLGIVGRKATKPEARDVLIEISSQIQKGNFVMPSNTTLTEYATPFLEDYYRKGKIKPTTYTTYLNYYEAHIKPDLGNIPIADITVDIIEEYYQDKLKNGRADGKKGGMSAKSINHIHNVLRVILKNAAKERKIAFNPAAEVTPPTPEKPEIKFWSWDEAKKFMEEAWGTRYYIYYAIALSTGMGRSEILGLPWININFDENTISVKQTLVATKDGPLLQDAAKTKSRIRTLPMTEKLKEELIEHQKKQALEIEALELINHPGLVLTTSKGNFVRPRDMDSALSRACKAAGVPHIGTHGLRHTFATRMYELGVDQRTVSFMLGHSNVATTNDIYTHRVSKLEREAVNLTKDLF